MFKKLLSLSAIAGLMQLVGFASGAETATTSPAVVNYDSIFEIPVEPMKAASTAKTTGTTLAAYQGDVLLIVNVASKCGLTPQYEGLEALHRKYHDQGFSVLGFPSNDFKGQEPGTEEQIVEFCKAKYDITFPLYAKVNVAQGTDKAPLYQYLTQGNHPGKSEVTWNFAKYLVGRDGKVIAHFGPKVKPDAPELITALENALKAKKP